MTGKNVFEQKGVEFPKAGRLTPSTSWRRSTLPVRRVPTQRESSLKHLIDRVADTITAMVCKKATLRLRPKPKTFREELKYILATQRAAFNSPVWFNIGAPERSQQASACFILAVEDTMASILNWYTEEGMIFKGGSGAGLNISTIRSSREQPRQERRYGHLAP